VEDSFRESIGKERMAWLDELAPASITTPDGKKAKLQYTSQEGPELQVKLHEILGWTEHLRVLEGKVPVKLWLATPEGKRIEPTLDWPTYKKSNYPKLKPALQKKFPGNIWL